MVAAGLLAASVVAGWFVKPYSLPPLEQVSVVPFLGTTLHNLRIILILVGGGVCLGLPTALVASWNGFQAGALFAAAGPSLWVALAVHGVPEVGGQFSATVGGLEIARQVVRRAAYDEPMVLRPVAWWIASAVALTVLAALLESRASPAVARAFLH